MNISNSVGKAVACEKSKIDSMESVNFKSPKYVSRCDIWKLFLIERAPKKHRSASRKRQSSARRVSFAPACHVRQVKFLGWIKVYLTYPVLRLFENEKDESPVTGIKNSNGFFSPSQNSASPFLTKSAQTRRISDAFCPDSNKIGNFEIPDFTENNSFDGKFQMTISFRIS